MHSEIHVIDNAPDRESTLQPINTKQDAIEGLSDDENLDMFKSYNEQADNT